MILKNTKLRNELKKFVNTHTEVDDVILFGSVVRGKKEPNDIDVIVLFESKVNKNTEYEIRKILKKFSQKISVISKTKETAVNFSFDARESILFEGFSLITKENLLLYSMKVQ